ncbi:hypothetical protein FKP32DRAFT_1069757 [Trametes sanguinea]|nr:hypothetical protein FKP32DRAFT_1069757 [Trametes sanguinea]
MYVRRRETYAGRVETRRGRGGEGRRGEDEFGLRSSTIGGNTLPTWPRSCPPFGRSPAVFRSSVRFSPSSQTPPRPHHAIHLTARSLFVPHRLPASLASSQRRVSPAFAAIRTLQRPSRPEHCSRCDIPILVSARLTARPGASSHPDLVMFLTSSRPYSASIIAAWLLHLPDSLQNMANSLNGCRSPRITSVAFVATLCPIGALSGGEDISMQCVGTHHVLLSASPTPVDPPLQEHP